MRNLLLAMSLPFILASCAKTMPPQQYVNFAKVDAGINSCLANNYIDYQTAGAGKNAISTLLGSWSYDRDEYQQTFANYSAMMPPSSLNQSDCNQLAAAVYQMTQEANQYRANRAAEAQQISNTYQTMQANAPKTSYCNRYGTQVICNTY